MYEIGGTKGEQSQETGRARAGIRATCRGRTKEEEEEVVVIRRVNNTNPTTHLSSTTYTLASTIKTSQQKVRNIKKKKKNGHFRCTMHMSLFSFFSFHLACPCFIIALVGSEQTVKNEREKRGERQVCKCEWGRKEVRRTWERS